MNKCKLKLNEILRPTPQLIFWKGKNSLLFVQTPTGRVRTGLPVTVTQHWQLSEELISSVPPISLFPPRPKLDPAVTVAGQLERRKCLNLGAQAVSLPLLLRPPGHRCFHDIIMWESTG